MTDYEARVKDILRFIREKDFAAELDPSKRAGWIQERLVELVRELAQEGRRSGEPVERLTARWEEELPDEDFWEEVRRRLDSELQPYRQTAFLRERTEEEQAALLEELFEHGIRYQEQRSWLKQELELTDEQVSILLKTYNTMIRWVVGNRMSRRYFLIRCHEAFGIGETLGNQLWDRLDGNRKILTDRFVYQAMSEQRQQTKQLLDAVLDFISIFEDEDEDEDEE